MPQNGRERPYGMPSSFMMGLHNSTSTYSDPVMNVTSPLQDSGSTINNRGRNVQPQIEELLPKCQI